MLCQRQFQKNTTAIADLIIVYASLLRLSRFWAAAKMLKLLKFIVNFATIMQFSYFVFD